MRGLRAIRDSYVAKHQDAVITAYVACVVMVAACETRAPAGRSAPGDTARGTRGDTAGTGATATAGARPTLALIRAADWIGSEWSEDAIRVGLQEENFQEGRDYQFRSSSAQGDPATLPSLIDAAMDAKVRVIIALQDATLQAALQRAKGVPIVFHILSDPFAAGAGTSDSSHLANVTGVYSPGLGDPEQEKRIDLIRRIVPRARRVGILFSPNEPLSVTLKDKMTQAGRKAGLVVVATPVNNANEGTDATNAIIGQRVEAIEIYGNVAHAAFPSIIKVANDHKIPVFSPDPFEMLKGAVAAIYPDFAEGGIVAGHMIGRILKGENPGTIPFYRVKTTRTSVSRESARNTNVTLSPELMRQADTSTRRPAPKP
jgi:ABC-type uncharacterized transport system substrate-binding protein